MIISHKRTDRPQHKGIYRVIASRYKEPIRRHITWRYFNGGWWERCHGEEIECWLEQQEVEPCKTQPE